MTQTSPKLTDTGTRNFVFRGNAVAAGGYLTKQSGKRLMPDANTLTTHGESCLPMIGGLSRSSVKPKLAYGNWVSYGQCDTFVWGRYEGDATVTSLSASVQDISITTSPSDEDHVPDVKTITFEGKRLAIEVESIHPRKGQPSFQVKSIVADGLVLVQTHTSGEQVRLPIQLILDQTISGARTMKQLQDAFLTNKTFFNQHAARFAAARTAPVFGKTRLPKEQGYYSGSLVKAIKVGDKTVRGNCLETKGFGTIIFGTILADDVSRRLNMATVRMGSDPGADVGFDSVETNGIWK